MLSAEGWSAQANTVVELDSYRGSASASKPVQYEYDEAMLPSGPVVDSEIMRMATEEQLTDAKLRTLSAETDTKIARFEGKLDLVLQKLTDQATALSNVAAEGRSNRNLVIATMVAGIIALFFGLFAALQWSDARMFGAIQLRDSIRNDAGSKPPKNPG
jgi:hypothetical protein